MPRPARKPTIYTQRRPRWKEEWESEAAPVVLEALRQRSMRLADLAKALRMDESFLHNVLSRLQRDDLVEPVRGYWVAVEDPQPWRHRR